MTILQLQAYSVLKVEPTTINGGFVDAQNNCKCPLTPFSLLEKRKDELAGVLNT